MNNYILLKIGSVLVASISQILLKKSANKQNKSLLKEYFNLYVILGYGLLIVSSLLSTLSLRGVTLSLSSIIESFSFIIIPILSYLLLKERINKKQILGIIVLIIGFIIYNQ